MGVNSFVEISERSINPKPYEGKLVITVGEIHSIVTVPETRLPYNAVITFKNQNSAFQQA